MCKFWKKQALEKQLQKLKKDKKQSILTLFILVTLTGLFFSTLWGDEAVAKRSEAREKIELSAIDPFHRIQKTLGKDVKSGEKNKKNLREERYLTLMQGHPMESMIPFISKKEEKVAAYLIGIGKKESNWGKHSPKKNGQECYNYWGYKGGYKPTNSGYSCFDSAEQAVEVVGQRIEKLLSQKIETPEQMVIWKCGSSCAGHDPKDVRKWISDVSFYFHKLKS